MINQRTSIGDRSSLLPPGQWKLVFSEHFDGPDAALDERWHFQNKACGHILCSRWRENIFLKDGILHLQAKKETRAGQDWTAGSMWTRQQFKYGYFECRYRYAGATATNNSFWLMNHELSNDEPGKFEIDINEGHYPNEIAMNIHNWSGEHWDDAVYHKIEGADLSEEYHTYGLEWNREELIWFYDGQEIRREKNTICHREAPVLLSLAIISWAGPVTDAIDGTSMKVDYVRVYDRID